MTRYELIKSAESILRLCDAAGIDPKEANYLPVYEDWQRLTKEGHKKVWILAYLSQRGHHQTHRAKVHKKGQDVTH